MKKSFKRFTLLLCGLLMGMMAASPAFAKTYTTPDNVLSLELPDDTWSYVEDPNSWITLSDGNDEILLQHYANGEDLPGIRLANDHYLDVYQVYFSTQNEVFIITGLVADKENMDAVRNAISSTKVLQYDTKRAYDPGTVPAGDYNLITIGKPYTVTAHLVNVREDCSTGSKIIGSLSEGNGVYVTGSVTRDGKEIGWYQIDYLGQDIGYVPSAFLRDSAAAPTPDPSVPTRTGKVQTLYYKNDGFSIYEFSDGTWKNDDGMGFTNKGDGRWISDDGGTCYDYYSSQPFRSDGSHANPTAINMTVYSENGSFPNVLTVYDNNNWYDQDYNPYEEVDDNVWRNMNDGSIWFESEQIFTGD